MLDAFEQFCKDHEKTIAFVEAFSTLGAVIVSLMLAFFAHRANQTRLKAWVGIKRMLHSTIPPEARVRYLTATITNTGIRPLSIPFGFFNWQLPRQKNSSWVVNPLNAYGGDKWVQQEQYPIQIAPKASRIIMVSDIATSRQEFQQMVRERPSLLRRILFRFVRVTILSDDGMLFKAKIGKEVRNEIRELNPLF
jgi:hypothetical protein